MALALCTLTFIGNVGGYRNLIGLKQVAPSLTSGYCVHERVAFGQLQVVYSFTCWCKSHTREQAHHKGRERSYVLGTHYASRIDCQILMCSGDQTIANGFAVSASQDVEGTMTAAYVDGTVTHQSQQV